jgi:hypothetical protein
MQNDDRITLSVSHLEWRVNSEEERKDLLYARALNALKKLDADLKQDRDAQR